jgi:hypothetical protein
MKNLEAPEKHVRARRQRLAAQAAVRESVHKSQETVGMSSVDAALKACGFLLTFQ